MLHTATDVDMHRFVAAVTGVFNINNGNLFIVQTINNKDKKKSIEMFKTMFIIEWSYHSVENCFG